MSISNDTETKSRQLLRNGSTVLWEENHLFPFPREITCNGKYTHQTIRFIRAGQQSLNTTHVKQNNISPQSEGPIWSAWWGLD
ncbi:hypothetical protein Q8A67_024689 [Cirrhinus molitorella]|uniref:Uncharacterized protein n=1 Tax=Cirrhinus molitorella TaxID=172907 RepID=A0AA88P537_9TELE|nr:hypothetical protein Q8A67_024689 [Cirrhinus molitorella]